MGQIRVSLSDEAQGLLDTLVEVFDSSRSNIVEELILNHVDDYANSRKEELDAWLEDQEEDEDEDEWLEPEDAQEEEEEED